MVKSPNPEGFDLATPCDPPTSSTPSQSEHLLRVAASVTRDANAVWAELWTTFKPHVTARGVVCPEMEKGFVPACGWAEFLEKYWLLKHYLDSIDRICRNKH